MIQVVDLRKTYENHEAVRGLTFSVPPGEVLGLVGPNGAGKTTTMRCITGAIPPTAGRVLICGRDVQLDPVGAKQELAFIPDEPRLFEYLTVREHLAFVARLYGVKDPKPRAQALLEELELTGKEDALPNTLSRGMKQKLAIACGLIHEPRAIMFDEPLTGLDPVAIRRIKESIRKRAAAGAAIIISSHLLNLVEAIATRILLLQQGQKLLHGTIAEIQAAVPDLQGRADLEEIFMRATGYETSATASGRIVAAPETPASPPTP
ncbi:MAG: ABC-type transporter ATP-binding protein EcsA [Planctomycetes bacterium]|nr:ABC-type transporter ATP-binding protein EcsA [Planctomycetota bacterium]